MQAMVAFLLISVSVGLLLSQPTRTRAADSPGGSQPVPATQPASIKYRIVRVVIPYDSAHRKDTRFSNPPDLYVVIKKDGKAIGSKTGSNTGWEVEYDALKPKNQFDIETSDTVSYTIELWDHFKVSRDVQVLSISGLKAGDFAKPIIEHFGEFGSEKRATRIEFKKVD